jgi:hypothetical protein
MRSRVFGCVLVLLCVVSPILAGAQNQPQAAKKKAATSKAAATRQAPPPPMEAKAIDILKATSLRLAQAHNLSFNAVEIFEHPSRQGDPLAYSTKYEVKLQRPDKLKVVIAGDGPASEFYYNGKVMMAYAPTEKLLAVADAPSTIDATLENAYHLAGIYFPFDDVIVADPYQDIAKGLQMAYYIGQSHVVGGTTTDIIAYVDGGVFIQMWVGADDKLPRMIHAMFLDDPQRLRHELVFSDWQLETTLPAETFEASDASGAKRIKFAHPNPEHAPGAKAPATPAGSKTN